MGIIFINVRCKVFCILMAYIWFFYYQLLCLSIVKLFYFHTLHRKSQTCYKIEDAFSIVDVLCLYTLILIAVIWICEFVNYVYIYGIAWHWIRSKPYHCQSLMDIRPMHFFFTLVWSSIAIELDGKWAVKTHFRKSSCLKIHVYWTAHGEKFKLSYIPSKSTVFAMVFVCSLNILITVIVNKQ